MIDDGRMSRQSGRFGLSVVVVYYQLERAFLFWGSDRRDTDTSYSVCLNVGQNISVLVRTFGYVFAE